MRMRIALVSLILAGFALSSTTAEAKLRKRQWIKNFVVTEYWPVPETWFTGKRVSAPGLKKPGRIDWLYSARGVSMEGDGVSADGRRVHVDCLGSAGWINAKGRRTVPGATGWSGGAPFWRNARIWFNKRGRPTYPLSAGGWSDGKGRNYRGNAGICFDEGPSRDLGYYDSIAVDPDLIPLGSRVYIPAYKSVNGGWFRAEDTGGAIIRRHVDVFRPPPAERFGNGRYLTKQRVLVDPPGKG
jgi:3D (Asp-Asp-Asp) domain-containing protein